MQIFVFNRSCFYTVLTFITSSHQSPTAIPVYSPIYASWCTRHCSECWVCEWTAELTIWGWDCYSQESGLHVIVLLRYNCIHLHFHPIQQTPPSHPHLLSTNPVPMQPSSLSNPPLSHPDPTPSAVNASTHSHLHSQINAPLRPPISTTPQSKFDSQKPPSNLSAPPLRHHLSPASSPYPPPNLEPPPTNFLSSVPQPGPQAQTTNPLMSAPSGLSIQAPVQGITQCPNSMAYKLVLILYL